MLRWNGRTWLRLSVAAAWCAGAIAGCGGGGNGDPAPSATCGNAIVDPGEECDDGNNAASDGCAPDCKKEVVGPQCGNGKIDAGEECDDGNAFVGDGCEPNCKKSPLEIVCAKLEPLPSGTCSVTKGSGTAKLMIGDLLLGGSIMRGGQVTVEADGKIGCVGCDCAAKVPDATVIKCPKASISPGLINSHDHITYAQNSPYNDTGERYEHRHEWRLGGPKYNNHTKIPSGGSATGEQISWGELRFVLGGATSTVGSGGQAGLLRNLDKTNLLENLNQKAVYYQTFPLGDSGGYPSGSGCSYMFKDTATSIADEEAYFPHISEGINDFARNEFLCASTSKGGGQDLAQPQSAFIHSIALKPNDYALMAKEKVTLVWSPRSNITLYGDTAVVTAASRLGVRIALGTDWMPSGSMNVLRELQCADGFNKNHLGGFFSDVELWKMVTLWGAQAAKIDDVVGALAPGKVADIAVFSASKKDAYRAVIDGHPSDVALVMRGGKTLYGDDAVVTALAEGCDGMDLCGSQKRVCLQSEVGKSLTALETAVGGIYPLFFCDTPEKEPSCTPSRPASVAGSTVYTGKISEGDKDGDGIANEKDNCPTVFNPVRPLDQGKQGDLDGDAVGDACDACPLDAGTMNCSSFSDDDSDGDGIPNAIDNCPDVGNKDQTDSDSDKKGDACDACPKDANPGDAPCPATVYQVKDGTFTSGAKVAVSNVIVTACLDNNGFFVQVKPGDAAYKGAEGSGIFVFDPKTQCGMTASVGDRVDLNPANVTNYQGQIELNFVTTKVIASGQTGPDPLVVTADQLTGSNAAKLDAVLVKLENGTVSDISPMPSPNDKAPTNEFVITDAKGSVRINDFLFLAMPAPVLGQGYTAIAGIATLRDGVPRIEPRNAKDVVIGPPVLVSLAPSPTFARLNAMASETFPIALTATLSYPAPGDVTVSLSSSDDTTVAFGGMKTGTLTITQGQASAKLKVDPLKKGMATVTATLASKMFTADVNVIDDAMARKVTQVVPAVAQVAPGGDLTMTVFLDIPAPSPSGSEVTLSLLPNMYAAVPATVTVPVDQLSATFKLTATMTQGSETLTAKLDPSQAQASITVKPIGKLVINEVDYDSVGTDTTEYIEIFNGTGSAYDLTDVALVLVNGSNDSEYKRVDLKSIGSLPLDGYLVIGSDAALMKAKAGAKTLSFGNGKDYIQNGSPDAIALIDTKALKVLDALSYEGSVTMANLNGFANPVSLLEGTALPAGVEDNNAMEGALIRFPNGKDSDDAKSDWAFSTLLTPGAANAK
jgi:cysteine-rich repeat protein